MPRVTGEGRTLPWKGVTQAEILAHDFAEAALVIADAPMARMDLAAVEAKRLQVELCKWLAAQLYPEMYGDSAAQEVSVSGRLRGAEAERATGDRQNTNAHATR